MIATEAAAEGVNLQFCSLVINYDLLKLQLDQAEQRLDKITSTYAGQFSSSQCFMRYVFEIINRLQGINAHIAKERFIIFHTDTHARRQSIGKRNTRLSPAAANSANAPDKYIVQNNETIDCRTIF